MFSTKSSQRKKGITEFALVCAVAFLGLSGVLARPGTQTTVMPGSVLRGERLLDEKECLHCHAVNGRGGNRAPDFTRSPTRANTPALFASVMWNHSPRMWAEFELQGRSTEWPRTTFFSQAIPSKRLWTASTISGPSACPKRGTLRVLSSPA